jgi:hypothetical protein
MKKFLHVAAIGIAACLAAQGAGAHEGNDSHNSSARNQAANAQPAKKYVSPVKTGTLLNTNVSPEQAKKVAEETNRQVLRQRSRR